MPFDDLQAAYPSIFRTGFAHDCGEGWSSIVARFAAATQSIMSAEGARIERVREAMGALRIETSYSAPFDQRYLRPLLTAEFRSRLTCEQCGEPGHMRKATGLLRCRCDSCATAEERLEPPRPAWTIGRVTADGYLWLDPAIDAARVVTDLASIGMPPHWIERIAGAVEQTERAD